MIPDLGACRGDVFEAGLHSRSIGVRRREKSLGEDVVRFVDQFLVIDPENFLDHLFAELSVFFKQRGSFKMRLHIVHQHVAVFLDNGAPGRDLNPGIVDLFCRIPEHRISHFHRDAITGKRKRRGIDGALLQRRDPFRITADLNQSHIAVRIEPLLSKDMAHEEIRE